MVERKLHWSAIATVACSYWLTFGLFWITASLYDMKVLAVEGVDLSGQRNLLVLATALVLLLMLRAHQRLTLLKNGIFSNAIIKKEVIENFDYAEGFYIKSRHTNFHYVVNKVAYKKTIWFPLGLAKKKNIPIIYNKKKPQHSSLMSRLGVYYNSSTKQWQSSLTNAIPRLTLLAMLILGFIIRLIAL